MKSLDLMLWVLASPILLLRAFVRILRRLRFLKFAYTSALRCKVCHGVISLVGMWRCSCGYTYHGHVLRTCPVCRSLPRMARCFQCGVTRSLPRP